MKLFFYFFTTDVSVRVAWVAELVDARDLKSLGP